MLYWSSKPPPPTLKKEIISLMCFPLLFFLRVFFGGKGKRVGGVLNFIKLSTVYDMTFLGKESELQLRYFLVSFLLLLLSPSSYELLMLIGIFSLKTKYYYFFFFFWFKIFIHTYWTWYLLFVWKCCLKMFVYVKECSYPFCFSCC